MANTTLPVNKGVVDGRDPTLLNQPGELQEGEGVRYKPTDPAAHKLEGRSAFNGSAIASKAVNGLKFVQFDSADDRLLAQVNGTLYSSTIAGASFGSIRTSLTATADSLDTTKVNDEMFCANDNDTNWVVKNDNTTFRIGLDEFTITPVESLGAGALTGTFEYWITEYDSTNSVEGAFNGTVLTSTPSSQDVTITAPAAASANNPNANKWRLYRTKTNGAFPTGWRVSEAAFAVNIVDSTLDAALVIPANAYQIITLNGLDESRDREPPVFRSIDTYEDSLVGLNGRALYWSGTTAHHSFPVSYKMTFRPQFGGQARCVRKLNRLLMVLFDNELYRLNYLPKAADSFFDGGIVQSRVGNFGTPSPNGAVAFSGWGGEQMLFFASRSGPMLTNGKAIDRAVKGIDWATHISRANLSKCVAVDNPDEWRVELYYPTSDTTSWRCIHFYYDVTRIGVTEGGFPEMVWTGPHIVPGPGTYAVVNGEGRVYTGSRKATGLVYQDYTGTSDAANLVDSSGTVNWRLRTGQFYPSDEGIGGEARLERVYVHKASAGSGSYTTTVTAHREETGSVAAPTKDISATTIGSTSASFNRGGKSFDVRLVRDDTLAMPAVNNITVDVRDPSGFEKTN